MTWIYDGGPITDSDVDGYYGFVYQITNKTTGTKYIGRKYLTKSKRYQKNGKKRSKRVSSDWETYYGSNSMLLEDIRKLGEDNFTREILRLCRTRSECNYYETKEILLRDCLLRDDYYNNWVSCKITRTSLKSK